MWLRRGDAPFANDGACFGGHDHVHHLDGGELIQDLSSRISQTCVPTLHIKGLE